MRGEHVATDTFFIGRTPELQGPNTARVISGEDHTAKRDIGCHLGRENRLFVKRFSAQSQRLCHDKKIVLTLENQPPYVKSTRRAINSWAYRAASSISTKTGLSVRRIKPSNGSHASQTRPSLPHTSLRRITSN